MENASEVTLKLTQKELLLLHTALWNQLGDLSQRMCALMTD